MKKSTSSKKIISELKKNTPGISLKATKSLLYNCCSAEMQIDQPTKKWLDKQAKYIVQSYKIGYSRGKRGLYQECVNESDFPRSPLAGEILKFVKSAYESGYKMGIASRNIRRRKS